MKVIHQSKFDLVHIHSSDRPGLKIFDPGLGQFFVARVRSGQPFKVWVWKISPKNVKFFIFSLQIKKYPGQRRVSLLFTAGQKLARVGSGSISNTFTLSPDLKRGCRNPTVRYSV